jgi:hypothetical protein
MKKDSSKSAGDGTGEDNTMDLLRRNLKMLLFELAARSETPGADLEHLLQDVISELYLEAKQALQERKSHLKLIMTS